MSVDISQFYQIFFEEAIEHLDSMEGLLLEIDIQEPELESLHAIFRAAHSIKGGAGTFGFHDMTESTHIMESLLDRLRNQEILLTGEMIDIFLESVDVLRAQVAAHQGTGEAVDAALLNDLCHRLRCLTDGSVEKNVSPKTTSKPTQNNVEISGHVDENTYTILFSDVPKGISWEGIEAEMRRLGKVECLMDGDEHVFIIETKASPDAMHESLGFVLQVSQYSILEGRHRIGTLVQSEDDSFGFFDAVAPIQPKNQPSASEEDLGYGFFEEEDSGEEVSMMDGIENALLERSRANAAAIVGEVNRGKAVQLDEVELALVASAIELSQRMDETILIKSSDDSYGFFEDISKFQKNNAIQTPENVSVEVEEKEAEVKASALKESSALTAAESSVAKTTASSERASKVNSRASDKPTAAASSDQTSIRVSIEKVDQMLNLVGELVITQSMLMQVVSHLDPAVFERLSMCLGQLDRNTRDLQESVMSIRMMPISFVFSRFPRVVRDVAGRLGKQVELRLVGESTELDRSLIEKIADPLTHLVRNSLDHGIETPEVRRERNKPEKGVLTLAASHQGGHIVIEVRDDGGGLNRKKILAKAQERGMSVHDDMSDDEVFKLIFEAGFSTADQITDVSGRGVGMDVVKRNILAMGGSVDISSALGVGTCMTIRLPLTLAILDGMSIRVGDETFIIPLASVIESLKPEPTNLNTISGNRTVLRVREEYIPTLDLHELFSIERPDNYDALKDGVLVIMESHGKKAAVWVDELLGQPQVVIKSLESNYRKVQGFSGATIMGDGRVALIIDVMQVVNMVNHP